MLLSTHTSTGFRLLVDFQRPFSSVSKLRRGLRVRDRNGKQSRPRLLNQYPTKLDTAQAGSANEVRFAAGRTISSNKGGCTITQFSTTSDDMVDHTTEPEDLDRGLQRAIREYKQVLEKDSSWQKGPYLVSDNVSKAAFEQWKGGQETHWKLAWEPSTLPEDIDAGNGFIWLYGDPTFLHEVTIGVVGRRMVEGLIALKIIDEVDIVPSLLTTLGSKQKEPDYAVVPSKAPLGTCPSVVFEVAYRNETKEELRREVEEWVAGNMRARTAIGIDITQKKATRRKAADVSLRVLYKRRGDRVITEMVPIKQADGSLSLPVFITPKDVLGEDIPDGLPPSFCLDLGPLEDRLRVKAQQVV